LSFEGGMGISKSRVEGYSLKGWMVVWYGSIPNYPAFPMTMAPWRDEYCTGDVRIDHEHQVLFALVNDLEAAIAAAAPPAQLQAILTTMAAHTVEHFDHEEALMQARDYPGYRRHKQVHDNLLAKVTALLASFNQPEVVVTQALTAFLKEWLAHHIQGEDQTMIRFLRAQTAPPSTQGLAQARSAQTLISAESP
jgi:hemerythrin